MYRRRFRLEANAYLPVTICQVASRLARLRSVGVLLLLSCKWALRARLYKSLAGRYDGIHEAGMPWSGSDGESCVEYDMRSCMSTALVVVHMTANLGPRVNGT